MNPGEIAALVEAQKSGVSDAITGLMVFNQQMRVANGKFAGITSELRGTNHEQKAQEIQRRMMAAITHAERAFGALGAMNDSIRELAQKIRG